MSVLNTWLKGRNFNPVYTDLLMQALTSFPDIESFIELEPSLTSKIFGRAA